ncbi:hypothetical protein DYBT9623_01291 [Dyadobacter sp. CECT 9623]|jgi:hypothetical protein|uniref:Uncharacterized protein n=1 Tax=Dyadobacter linearis TaxID=2823330 RepID=A0ABM8UM75_9BACT|nr:hypothetical protein [Dyadobacter sp. CECT 9623]CAG5068560.1 hypothetical protein DYBT9623_01291 [Dyadobacter sp. CECT 9623]
MQQTISDQRFTEGQFIFAKSNPDQKLVIRRYYKRIYYCRAAYGGEKEYPLFESEIIAAI